MTAQDSLPVHSETVPDDSSLEDVLKELNNSTDVPICVKKAFAKFLVEFQTVVRERDDLREENRLLRKKMGIPDDLNERHLLFLRRGKSPGHQSGHRRAPLAVSTPRRPTTAALNITRNELEQAKLKLKNCLLISTNIKVFTEIGAGWTCSWKY
ncbi:hypothetical protein Q1695_006964 [Nippostrongylus brasiliensis]|nr:hypothetical protein Q1695_006964 [Nippostrongylus brasiliensis]